MELQRLHVKVVAKESRADSCVCVCVSLCVYISMCVCVYISMWSLTGHMILDKSPCQASPCLTKLSLRFSFNTWEVGLVVLVGVGRDGYKSGMMCDLKEMFNKSWLLLL
jgi:hypothetical protein